MPMMLKKKVNLEFSKLSNGLKRAAEKKQTELEKKNLLDLSLKNSLNHPKNALKSPNILFRIQSGNLD